MMQQNYTFPKDELRLLATQLADLVYEDRPEEREEMVSALDDEDLSQDTLLSVIDNLLTAIGLREVRNEYVDLYNDMMLQLQKLSDDAQAGEIKNKLQKMIADSTTSEKSLSPQTNVN